MSRTIGSWFFVLSLIVLWNCVGPEEPVDGLITDIPAVTNTADVFSFILKGNQFTFEEEYQLIMQPDSNSVLITSLIVQNWSGNDTTKILLINGADSTYLWFQLKGNLLYSSVDSLSSNPWNHPEMIIFNGSEFSGTLQYSLVKG